MDAQLLNSFLSVTRRVIKDVSQYDSSLGKPNLKDNPISVNGVTVIVGVTGDIKGSMVVGFDKDSALSLAGKMTMNPDLDSLGEMENSALSELVNMTMGNALTELSNMGYTADITPPIFVEGGGVKISVDTTPLLSIPVSLDENRGVVTVDLSLKDYTNTNGGDK